MRFLSLARVMVALLPAPWNPAWGQAPSVGMRIAQNPQKIPSLTSPNPQIGTQVAPLIAETHPRPESKEEPAGAQADKEHAGRIELWTLIFTGAATAFTGLLVIIGYGGVRAAVRTLRAVEGQLAEMRQQADAMDQQIRDARESSAQTFAVLKDQTDNLLISAKAATVSALAADHSAKAAPRRLR